MKIFGYSIRVELVILSLILLFVINLNMICGCTTVTPTEGFEAVKEGVKALEKVYKKFSRNQAMKTEGFVDSNAQQTNAPKQKLSYFEQYNFSTECCPSKYTSSSGCACMPLDKTKDLVTRGGNSQEGELL